MAKCFINIKKKVRTIIKFECKAKDLSEGIDGTIASSGGETKKKDTTFKDNIIYRNCLNNIFFSKIVFKL